MRTSKEISKGEYKFLLVISLMLFGFTCFGILGEILENYHRSISQTQFEFSDCSIRFSFPFAYLLSICIVAALFFAKRFLLSSLLTFAYALLGVYIIYFRFETFAESRFGEMSFGFLEQLDFVVFHYDYINFTLTFILLFWQISILLRMLIKTLQRNDKLP